jgi:FMN phosphatase YigB (HAD superfamily)
LHALVLQPQCQPTIHLDTIKAIKYIHENTDVTLSIGSNTNFISGKTLQLFLQEAGIWECFSFALFSDLLEDRRGDRKVNVCKPNVDFFIRMINYAGVLHNQKFEFTEAECEEIMHIGDSVHDDFEGARNRKIQAELISSPEELAPLLMAIVNSN